MNFLKLAKIAEHRLLATKKCLNFSTDRPAGFSLSAKYFFICLGPHCLLFSHTRRLSLNCCHRFTSLGGTQLLQISHGKATPEYAKYLQTVPVDQRGSSKEHPRTPDPHRKYRSADRVSSASFIDRRLPRVPRCLEVGRASIFWAWV
jgi:hypothetical protein